MLHALKEYGGRAQIEMVFEEMSELQKELCKWLRGKGHRDHIAEEIADVEIMLEQLKLHFCLGGMVEEFRGQKIDRLRMRLGGATDNPPEWKKEDPEMEASFDRLKQAVENLQEGGDVICVDA